MDTANSKNLQVMSPPARDGGLFQSKEWADFQRANGVKVIDLSNEQYAGLALVHTLPFIGNSIYIPRGPLLASGFEESFKQAIERIAQEENAAWIRVEPQTSEILQSIETIFANQVKRAPRNTQPREILTIPLDGTCEEWLMRMKSKTRYNVRLAEKHGVTVRFSREEKDIETFLALVQSTSNRKAIHPHPSNYYRNFFTSWPREACTLALAEQNGQALAVALLIFFDGYAYYLHGGSSDDKREMMAPFLLHLSSMGEAKRRGCHFYDFGGIRLRSKSGDKDTEWDGITRFKRGFVPETESILFPGTYDIVLNKGKYFLYNILRKLQRSLKS